MDFSSQSRALPLFVDVEVKDEIRYAGVKPKLSLTFVNLKSLTTRPRSWKLLVLLVGGNSEQVDYMLVLSLHLK